MSTPYGQLMFLNIDDVKLCKDIEFFCSRLLPIGSYLIEVQYYCGTEKNYIHK